MTPASHWGTTWKGQTFIPRTTGSCTSPTPAPTTSTPKSSPVPSPTPHWSTRTFTATWRVRRMDLPSAWWWWTSSSSLISGPQTFTAKTLKSDLILLSDNTSFITFFTIVRWFTDAWKACSCCCCCCWDKVRKVRKDGKICATRDTYGMYMVSKHLTSDKKWHIGTCGM